MIQRIVARFAHFRIRGKMIVIYLLIGVLPFLAFTLYSYSTTNRQMVQSEQALLQNALDQAVLGVNNTLEMYNTISNYLFNEPSILTALNKSYGSNYYSMYEAYKYAITPVVMTYYSLYPDLSRMTIYTACDILPFGDYVLQSRALERQPWFDQVRGKFAPTWLTAHAPDGRAVLLSVRRIGVPSEYPHVNYLYLEIDYDSVFEPLMNLSPDGYGVLIADAQGGTVFASSTLEGIDANQLPDVVKPGALKTGATYRVIETTLSSNRWTVFFVSDPNSVFGAVSRITNATYRSVWMVLLSLGLVAVWFISSLVRPIEQLTKNISQIDDGHMDITVTTNRQDEIGVLVHSFAEMMARIRALIDVTYKNELEKRDYEQRLLSAQINPHFLYNSLSLINARAIVSGQSEISQTAILLSQFYRSALNHGMAITTLDNELSNIRSYVNLQQLLSDCRFEARYDIDERLRQVRIPNFILQPIVENAIDHGLKNSPSPDRLLRIRVESQADTLTITIHDNGIGMDEKAIAALFTQQSGGYGIKNVRDRLLLLYRGQCELHISSKPNAGTTAILRMPRGFFG